MILALSTVVALAVGAGAAPAFEDIPKMDVHAHFFDDMPEFVEMLERIDMRVINICVYGTQPELLVPAEMRAEMLYQKYKPHMFFCSTFDLTRRDQPDYAQNVIAWLDKTFAAGAVSVKIWKDVGMEIKSPDGKYIMPDNDMFDPIYDHIAKAGKPLTAHLADPLEAWQPLKEGSQHYKYYSQNPQWYVYGREGFPSHEQIMVARDNVLAKHPDLILIGCHLASLDHDLDALAQRLDKYPNLYVDVSARTGCLRAYYTPEKVRDFFVKYQDRILYGTDSDKFSGPEQPPAEDRAAFTESMEKTYRADFDYYTRQVGLPEEVLEKFYHGNAERLMPALK